MGSSQGDDLQLNGDLACQNAEVRGQLRVNGAPITPGGSVATDGVTIFGDGTGGQPLNARGVSGIGGTVDTTTTGIVLTAGTGGQPIEFHTQNGGIYFEMGLTGAAELSSIDGVNAGFFATNLGFYEGFGALNFQSLAGSGVFDDFALTHCFLRVAPSGGGATLAGILPSSGIPLWAIVNIFNIGPDPLTIIDEAPTSSAFARFRTIGAAPVVIPQFGGVHLQRFDNGLGSVRWGIVARSV